MSNPNGDTFMPSSVSCQEPLECYFCNAEFEVESHNLLEEIRFCPYCGEELADPTAVISIGNEGGDEGGN